MIKKIKLNDKEVEYELKVSKRASRMRLAIYGNGSFVITKPNWLSDAKLSSFINQKADWILSKLEGLPKVSQKSTEEKKKHYQRYRERARVFIHNELKLANQFYGFKYNRVSIRNQRTVWGSCSANKNLNFSYRIYFLPEDLARYIIVHELCHLQEMNHSQKFWNIVAETVPDHKLRRRKLKKQVNI